MKSCSVDHNSQKHQLHNRRAAAAAQGNTSNVNNHWRFHHKSEKGGERGGSAIYKDAAPRGPRTLTPSGGFSHRGTKIDYDHFRSPYLRVQLTHSRIRGENIRSDIFDFPFYSTYMMLIFVFFSLLFSVFFFCPSCYSFYIFYSISCFLIFILFYQA